MTEDIALASLVEDFTLYPRHNVDDTHVSDLARALASGARLPPIIVDAASKRVVDGVHRRRALLKFLGDGAIVPVEMRTYENEAALFLEAVALNSVHGRRLDRHDQTRIVLKLREFGIADQVISIILHVPEPIVEKLSLRIVTNESGESVPAKRGLEHMHGQRLTAAQMSAVDSVRSAEVGRICIELMKLLEARVVNLNDTRTVNQLRQLNALIEATLESIAA